MADDGSDFEYLSPASFEWDDQKRELNLAKHGSRARKNEEREYRNAKVGRPPEGQD